MAKLSEDYVDRITLKQRVPRVEQHDINTCCGTTCNSRGNLKYVQLLEERVGYLQQLLDIYHCDTIAQLARHLSGLTKRCEVLTQQVNQLKQPNDPEDYSNIAGNFY
jgi:hypothetical protein